MNPFLLSPVGLPDVLFARESLARILDDLANGLAREVADWPADDLLATPEEDVVQHLTSKYSRDCPIIDQAAISVLDDDGQVDRDISNGLFRDTFTVRRTLITIAVPFTGDAEIFKWRPNRFTSVPPRAQVVGQELHLTWEGSDGDPDRIKSMADQAIAGIQQWLDWSRHQVDQHNREVAANARSRVSARHRKVLGDRDLRAAIGFQLRRRDEGAAVAAPIKRRKITTRPSPPSTGAFRPEPAISDADYNAAIEVLINQRNALERSPSTYRTLGEEAIRNILLVGLNAQFEGQAAGEVFNNTGKTDILIRVEDKHAFIGECKIWKGPKTIPDTLDQLLGYLTWRDTKAAFLLFIRSGAPTEIIAKAVAELRKHPNYKRDAGGDTEDRYNFVFHANGDTAREIKLALLPFHLPTADGSKQP
ncbi:hypothetical protein [Streptomyces sp. NPDC037389]|uniref:hypothetical protein n=1 Tax=Streptomyces sp. NPDC037389 TaxID=3155369 RepID=UPI003404B763